MESQKVLHNLLRILVDVSQHSSSSESDEHEQYLMEQGRTSPAPSLASIRSEHAKVRRQVRKSTILTSIFFLIFFTSVIAFLILFKVFYQGYEGFDGKNSRENSAEQIIARASILAI